MPLTVWPPVAGAEHSGYRQNQSVQFRRQLGLRARCLQTPGSSSRPASLSARRVAGRLSVPAHPKVLGSRARESGCPWTLVCGSRLWDGVWLRCSLAVALPGRIRALPTPTVSLGALRAGLAAAGEGRGLAAQGAQPPAGGPHPADNGQRELSESLRPGGRGLSQRASRGPSRPGGAARGWGPGRSGIFQAMGTGTGGGGINGPTPAEREAHTWRLV